MAVTGDADLPQARPAAPADLVSDDERSVAADSWSIKSDYGSISVDEEQRQADAAEALATSNLPPTSDYSSDKEAPDATDVDRSLIGLKSYWDAIYAEDLANFNEHGHAGEVWFGAAVSGALVTWTRCLCAKRCQGLNSADTSSDNSESNKEFSSVSVLDIGTGNGLLLQELAKQGFSDLTGTDYSQDAIDLAQNLASRDGFPDIKFLVDDILESKLDREYHLVVDKGTLDSIGMHPDGPVKRTMYWESVSRLVAPGGILVIASGTSTKDDLLQEAESMKLDKSKSDSPDQEAGGGGDTALFQYLDHCQAPPASTSEDAEASCVAFVAFLRK